MARIPGEAMSSLNPEDLILPGQKSEQDIAEMLAGNDAKVDPKLDLWNLVGQHQQGGLPDKTAPDYVARNTSAEIHNYGLLTLINVIVFAPAGVLLGALKDKATGVIVGWNLLPYEGNELTVEQVKQARTAVEQKWPGLQQMLMDHHQMASRINLIEVEQMEMDNPEWGPTPREQDRAQGIEKTERSVKQVFTEVGGQMVETTFEEQPVDGSTLMCAVCNLVPIVGDLMQYEPIEIEDGGGFRCPTCQQSHVESEMEAIDAEYRRKREAAGSDADG